MPPKHLCHQYIDNTGTLPDGRTIWVCKKCKKVWKSSQTLAWKWTGHLCSDCTGVSIEDLDLLLMQPRLNDDFRMAAEKRRRSMMITRMRTAQVQFEIIEKHLATGAGSTDKNVIQQRYSGVVCDNASNMSAALNMLEAKYPKLSGNIQENLRVFTNTFAFLRM